MFLTLNIIKESLHSVVVEVDLIRLKFNIYDYMFLLIKREDIIIYGTSIFKFTAQME